MDNLFNIFEREKKNNPDLTVHYNKFSNSLDYSNENGVLTVLFNPDGNNGCEEFYFKQNKHEKGFGELVLKTNDYGRIGVSPDYILQELPEEFIKAAQRYQFDRDTIGIEQQKSATKAKNHSKNEIDRD